MLEINWKIEDSMKVWLLLHKEAFEQKSGKQEIVPEMFYPFCKILRAIITIAKKLLVTISTKKEVVTYTGRRAATFQQANSE